MGETLIAPPPAEEPPADSFLSRAIGMFISPGRAFESIARRPDFLVPLLAMVFLSIAGTETFLAKIGIAPILQWAFEHNRRTSSMSPSDIQALVQKTAPIYTMMAHVTAVLWVPFLTLLIALIGLGMLRWIFGVDMSFKLAFSIPSYAYLINLPFSVITFLIIFVGDPEHFASNPQNPSPTSVGFFMSPEGSKPLLALGSALEIFTLWYMVLLGIGFSEASGKKVKPATIFFIFFGFWLVWTLAKMGLATLG